MTFAQELSIRVLWYLADASIRSLIPAAVVAVLLIVPRLRLAALQHALWTAVLFAMLLMPAANFVPASLRVPVKLDISQAAPFNVRNLPDASPATRAFNGAVPIRIQGTQPKPKVPEPSGKLAWQIPIASLYLATMLGFVARFVIGLRLARRLIATGSVIRDSRANEILQHVSALNSRRLPLLIESDRICTPAVTVADTILLPSEWRTWDEWKLRAVLVHEMAHIRRGDWLLAAIAALNKCVFWFHPLAWWIERRLSVLSEHASDNEAVLTTGDAPRYANVLLEFASSPERRRLGLAALSMAGARSITGRIQRLLEMEVSLSGVLPGRAWLAIAVCSIPCLAVIAAPQQRSAHSADVPGWRQWEWQVSALRTSDDKAKDLEAYLLIVPDDLEARSGLISYYAFNAEPAELDRHVLWLIENRPDSNLAGSEPVAGMFFPNEPGRERKKQPWLQQAAKHGDDVRVLGNAGLYMAEREPAIGLMLFKRALQLEPNNLRYRIWLERIYARAIHQHLSEEAGARQFWQNLDPADVKMIKDDLDQSTDANLVGGMAQTMLRGVAAQRSMPLRDALPGRQSLESKTLVYGKVLLRKAASLDPSKPLWSDALKDIEGASQPATSPTGTFTPPSPDTLGTGDSQRVVVSAADQESRFVSGPEPVYPPLARQAGIQGRVELYAVISPEGRVRSVTVVKGHRLFKDAALEAVKQWVYEPSILNGVPVQVGAYVNVDFRLTR